MDYNQRMRIVRAELGSFLEGLDCPTSWTPEVQAREADALAEDVNSEIRSTLDEGQLKDILAKMIRAARKQMKARRWPTSAILVDAVRSAQRDASDLPSAQIDLSPIEIARRRFQNREPVPEGYLWGRTACEIIKAGAVTREQMEARREAAYRAHVAFYGRETADIWLAEMRSSHEAAKAMLADMTPRKYDTSVDVKGFG